MAWLLGASSSVDVNPTSLQHSPPHTLAQGGRLREGGCQSTVLGCGSRPRVWLGFSAVFPHVSQAGPANVAVFASNCNSSGEFKQPLHEA